MKNLLLLFAFFLIVNVGYSQQTFTEDVEITTPSLPSLIIHRQSPTNPLIISNDNDTRAAITKTNTSGNANFDIDAVPADGAGNARFRFFRATNTTGEVTFDVLRGNNTAAANCRISGNTDSYLNRVVGNVGIGTGTPQSKLSVKGGIESQEIQVKANVADYVFSENYQLMSLQELEKFIQENGHLPKIQTQKEVDNNRGLVKLGELSISLMEKVEELTLHLIEMDKKLNQLEKENLELKRIVLKK